MWDVFISHASEDKKSFARPLAQELENYGLRVWFDEFVLSPGDFLRRKIDDGLVNSKMGIVILSPNFFAKQWPQAELDALFSLLIGGTKKFLPVWHELKSSDIERFSPLLAGILALRSDTGVKAVAEVIAQKLDCKGQPLKITIDGTTYEIIGGVEALATAIRKSEDIPGSYTKRRITVSFRNGQSKFSQEITRGIRYLVTLAPLTFYSRTSYLLTHCVANYVSLYNPEAWISLDPHRTKIDLYQREEPRWYTGIYVIPEEESHIANIIGVPDLLSLRGVPFPIDMLDLGADILATKAIPKILFEFFRQEQRKNANYDERVAELLALSNWTFGPG